MCLKFIDDATFKPVNKKINEKEYNEKLKAEYAPFHCFANYIEKRGCSGIIYNSTVDKTNKGLNLVLFDRDDVKPYGSVKSYNSL